MTREEAKLLESDIANDILNNYALSGLVVLATESAKTRAKQVMDDSTEERLTEMKGKYAEAKSKLEQEAKKAEEAQASSENATGAVA